MTLDLSDTVVLSILLKARDEASAVLRRNAQEMQGWSSTARLAMGAVGLASAGMLAGGIREATRFQTLMSNLQGNTTLTNQQIQTLSVGIQRMAEQSGAPLDQLAGGIRHITNVGFSAKDSLVILEAAMESALSTGGDTAAVANVLGVQMHEFGMSAAEAGRAMNVLHLAAAESNTTLDVFVNSTSKAVAMAANLGVSFTATNAALAALGRHMDISQASTAFAGELVKVVASSKGAHKILLDLSHKTGIDLVGDFTSAGLAARGFTRISDDLAKATKGNATEMLNLIAATRGGLAALVLAGTGAKDYRDILSDLTATMAGKTDPTSIAFARQQGTLAAQFAKVHESVLVLEIALGTVLLPPLTRLMEMVTPIAAGIAEWARAHAQLADVLLGGSAALGLLAGGMTVLGAALGPVVAGIGALAAPLLAVSAAAAGLVVAWQNDWGNIRERAQAAWAVISPILTNLRTSVHALASWLGGDTDTMLRDLDTLPAGWRDGVERIALTLIDLRFAAQSAWHAIQPVLTTMGHAFQAVLGGFQTGGLAGGSRALVAQLRLLGGDMMGWLQGMAPVVERQLGQWARAFWAWVQPASQQLLSQLGPLATQVFTWVQGQLPGLGQHLEQWGGTFWQWVRKVGPPLTRELSHLITLGLAAIVAMTPQVVSTMAKLSAGFMEWFLTTGAPELNAFGVAMGNAILQGMGDALGDRIKSMPGDYLKGVKDQAGTWGFWGLPDIGAAAGAVGNTVGGAFGGSGAAAAGAMPPLIPMNRNGIPSLQVVPFRNTATPPVALGGGTAPWLTESRAGSTTVTNHAEVHVHLHGDGTTSVTASGTGGAHALGQQVADDVIARLDRALRSTSGPAGRQLAGARTA